MRPTSCPEAMGWGFLDLKKRVSWDSTLEEGRQFLIWARPDQWSTGCPRVGWVRELRADEWRTVSIVRNCVSLLMSENLKLKKVNKSFVPEPKESRHCFVYFGIPYIYFTYSYLGHILNILVDILHHILFIHTKYIWFVWFLSLIGISTFVGYLMPKPFS